MHSLPNETGLGIVINRFKSGDSPTYEKKVLESHRDDHYIFFIVEKKSRAMMVDFNEIELSKGMLYYILPGQVHHRIYNENSEGWFIAVDTSLVSPECRNVFESGLWAHEPYTLSEAQLKQYNKLMVLLNEKYQEDFDKAFLKTAVHALLQSFLAITAGHFMDKEGTMTKVTRSVELTSQFKSLLSAEARSIKSPASYASRLNVTEGYLNESLKKTTGFTVSYWIQQEVILEAKRLLYHTRLNVKEISHILGYEDHSYFSRLFRKAAGISAIAFREHYHK